jgi:lysophospholipase
LYDQRGHGRSARDTDRPELIHVNSFDQLVEDLDCYIRQIVLPSATVPLYLYAHSMGGAVGLMYLAKHPRRFAKAVLTSPLVAPRMNNLPAWPFLLGVSIRKRFVGDLKKFRLSGEYVPGKPYRHIPGDSEARIRRCLWHRDRNRCYQSTPMTLGCVYHNLKLRRRMMKGDLAQAIQTPTLMICADRDHMVKLRPQEKLAAQCPRITREVLQGANHNLLTDEQPILEQVIYRVLEFYHMQ